MRDLSTTSANDELSVLKNHILWKRQTFYQTLFTDLALTEDNMSAYNHSLFGDSEVHADIYTYPAAVFGDVFTDVSAELIVNLSYAGRLILDYIILYDLLIDTQFDPVTLMLSYACQREYLKCLHGIFPLTSNFWQLHDKLDSHTKRTVLGSHTRQENEAYTFAAYRAEAHGKASMSSLAIHSLLELSQLPNKHEKASRLLKSIESFTVAFQILDDLSDWREDFREKNLTYPLYLAQIAVSIPTAEKDTVAIEATIRNKLYTTIAVPLLEIAGYEIDSALELGGNSRIWSESLRQLGHRIETKIDYIRNFLTIAEQNRFNLKNAALSSTSNVQAACRAASTYIVSRQSPSGSWQDFLTFAGHSDIWVTGYVAAVLAQVNEIPDDILRNAKTFLLEAQNENGWSYSKNVIRDADSTAWCLRALTLLGVPENSLSDSFNTLLYYQHESGAFSTYRNHSQVCDLIKVAQNEDLTGWLQGHMCVTTAVLGTLADKTDQTPTIHKALDFLFSNGQAIENIQSYWWLTPMYTICHLAYAFHSLDETEVKSDFMSRLVAYLKESQQAEGYWNLCANPEVAVFETALAVWALSLSGCQTLHNVLSKGVNWLLSNQKRDGSWLPSSPLRIPLPSDQTPWGKHTWPLQASSEGFEYVTFDQSRVYTTTTVLQALEHYRTHWLST